MVKIRKVMNDSVLWQDSEAVDSQSLGCIFRFISEEFMDLSYMVSDFVATFVVVNNTLIKRQQSSF